MDLALTPQSMKGDAASSMRGRLCSISRSASLVESSFAPAPAGPVPALSITGPEAMDTDSADTTQGSSLSRNSSLHDEAGGPRVAFALGSPADAVKLRHNTLATSRPSSLTSLNSLDVSMRSEVLHVPIPTPQRSQDSLPSFFLCRSSAPCPISVEFFLTFQISVPGSILRSRAGSIKVWHRYHMDRHPSSPRGPCLTAGPGERGR